MRLTSLGLFGVTASNEADYQTSPFLMSIRKKVGSTSEFFFNNFRSGAEFKGEESLKKNSPHTGCTPVFLKKLARRLRYC